MSQKILIVTASYGNGHMTAAKTLFDRLQKEGKNPEIFDIATQTWGGKFIKIFFENVSSNFLEKIFDAQNHPFESFWDLFSAKILFGRQTQKILHTFQPNEVYCTFPLETSLLKQKFSGKVSVFVTDYFSPHLTWAWGNPDKIFCLDVESKTRFEKYFPEISPHSIAVQPFPLSQKFLEISAYSDGQKNEIRTHLSQQYNTPEDFFQKKIFLLFFHHVLFGNEKKIIEKILAHPEFSGYSICILAGKNTQKFSQYSSCSAIHIFEWREDITSLYAIADAVGGKCGGAFISEVMALDLPLLITGVFSGQEKGNQKFLERYYANKLLHL